MVPFIALCKVVVAAVFFKEILKRDHSHESNSVALSCGAVS